MIVSMSFADISRCQCACCAAGMMTQQCSVDSQARGDKCHSMHQEHKLKKKKMLGRTGRREMPMISDAYVKNGGDRSDSHNLHKNNP